MDGKACWTVQLSKIAACACNMKLISNQANLCACLTHSPTSIWNIRPDNRLPQSFLIQQSLHNASLDVFMSVCLSFYEFMCSYTVLAEHCGSLTFTSLPFSRAVTPMDGWLRLALVSHLPSSGWYISTEASGVCCWFMPPRTTTWPPSATAEAPARAEGSGGSWLQVWVSTSRTSTLSRGMPVSLQPPRTYSRPSW